MRYSRQNKILDIINSCEVDTQEKLALLLKKNGFSVTQATISRDIKEMQLVKAMTPSGRYRYTAGTGAVRPVTERFVKIFRETIQTVAHSGNIIIVKTLPGCAGAAAETIDSLGLPNILGSVAGDNTIMLVVSDPADAPAIVAQFEEMTEV
ncbi:MAG: arginine repressor [Clostridiales Family XIII bacterium]|jgi:transcriptional regulator of arginine metabolism|nr:arginine repressor [Clostridiales Family XIII bacterium]